MGWKKKQHVKEKNINYWLQVRDWQWDKSNRFCGLAKSATGYLTN